MQNACMKQQTTFVYVIYNDQQFLSFEQIGFKFKVKKFRPTCSLFFWEVKHEAHIIFFALLKNEIGLHSLKSIMNKKISLLFLFVLSFPVLIGNLVKMGIQGLLPFLKKIHVPINIAKFTGCTVAIDAYCWLHKGAFSCAEKLVLGEKTDQ